MKLIALGALAGILAVSTAAATVHADVSCRTASSTPVFDCTIRLTDSRTEQAISHARFSVSADMPSMPMVHNVRPVNAVETGAPGCYSVRLSLEMYGTWTVKLRVTSPVETQIYKNVEFFGGG
jgi:YtkA-like